MSVKQNINGTLVNIAGSGSTIAERVTYDNTESGLTATDVQNAIDEVKLDLNGTQKTYILTSIVGTHEINIKQYDGLLTLHGFAGISGAASGQLNTILTINDYDGIPRQGIAFFGDSNGIATASPIRSCIIDNAGNLKVSILSTDTGDFLFFRVAY